VDATLTRRTRWLHLLAASFLAAGLYALAGPAARSGPPARGQGGGEPLPRGAVARMGSRLAQVFQVDRLCLSADGKTLATASKGSLRLWDVASNTLRRSLPGHDQRTLAVTFSPDGRLLASSGADRTVKLWDVQAGRLKATLADNPAPVPALAFAPDGKALALGGGALRVWDVATEKVRVLHNDGQTEFPAVAFAPDGRLAAGDGTGAIRLWDLGAGRSKELGHQPGSGGVACLAVSPDGKVLASSAGDDDRILLWDVAAGKVRHTLRGERFAGACLAFSADGAVLASCSANRKAEEPAPWPVRRPFGLPPPPGKGPPRLPGQAAALPPPPPPPPPPAFPPVVTSTDHTVRLWDVATGKEIRRLKGHRQQVHTMAFAGGTVAAASQDIDSVRLWDVKTQGVRHLGGHRGMVRRVVFAADGKWLWTSGDDGTLRLWQARTGEELRQVGKAGAGGTGAFTRDGARGALVVGQAVAVFDLRSGRELFQTPKQENTVAGLDFSPDGALLASGTVRWLRLWDADGQEVRKLEAHGDLIIRLAFSPDGKALATGGWDHDIRLWDVATGRKLHELPRQPSALESVAYSPDGRLLASGDTGGRIRLWDPASGKLVRTLRQQGPIVFGLGFAPDGRFLAASGPGNTVGVWEVASGQEVVKLAGHQNEVTCAAFSLDGRLLASGGWDATVFVWDWQKDWRSGRDADQNPGRPELETLWAQLAGADALQGLRAAAALSAGGDEAVAFLGKHLGAGKGATAEQVQRWISDLGSERFAVREAASRNLERLGRAAEPALRQALARGQPLEVRRRLEAVLTAATDGRTSPENLRLLRGVLALELAGTASARAALEALARGPASGLLREAARRALRRLAAGG
jgi:WD40 repeat protein